MALVQIAPVLPALRHRPGSVAVILEDITAIDIGRQGRRAAITREFKRVLSGTGGPDPHRVDVSGVLGHEGMAAPGQNAERPLQMGGRSVRATKLAWSAVGQAAHLEAVNAQVLQLEAGQAIKLGRSPLVPAPVVESACNIHDFIS
jgi:hypothetical protein